jgi:hypothetical protein
LAVDVEEHIYLTARRPIPGFTPSIGMALRERNGLIDLLSLMNNCDWLVRTDATAYFETLCLGQPVEFIGQTHRRSIT